MNSLILQTVARILVPVQVLMSLFLLVRGHNEPGGGFIAGLVLAISVGLYGIAFSGAEARERLRVEPLRLAGIGLGLALLAGIVGLLAGEPFLTGQWFSGYVLGVKLGTPLLFDVGVYLVVAGVATGILFSLMD